MYFLLKSVPQICALPTPHRRQIVAELEWNDKNVTACRQYIMIAVRTRMITVIIIISDIGQRKQTAGDRRVERLFSLKCGSVELGIYIIISLRLQSGLT